MVHIPFRQGRKQLEFACAMAGVILVTVNPALQASEVEYVLNQSRSAGLIVATNHRGNPMRKIADEIAPNCNELREIIAMEDVLEMGQAADPEIELPEVGPDNAVMIQYTLIWGMLCKKRRAMAKFRRSSKPPGNLVLVSKRVFSG